MAAARYDIVMLTNFSVARNRGIDLGPRIDTAGEIEHALETLARKIHRDLRAAHSMMAHDDGFSIAIKFRQSRRNVAHRNVQGTGNRGCGDFPRLAYVND